MRAGAAVRGAGAGAVLAIITHAELNQIAPRANVCSKVLAHRTSCHTAPHYTQYTEQAAPLSLLSRFTQITQTVTSPSGAGSFRATP